ncbi:nicotinamide riboside transporter PnuC [Cytobacillus purgationiresistens]|uniref:Nicotinamide mononucleotide transporter n=1 Tax=Cytobacillus purgationiresistens TaxID=863449 RepID=A0ABU0AIB5_9BACI|nr:nicotinamide riboside transporter PnuC [Cytobacillus purgationiresistens]MDQ0270998.1 nicotinamide mononucleotide transporter [Cytobacillus purgationiresistens]
MNIFKDWTIFEKIWLSVFTLVNVYLFFAWGDSLLGFISSITGMLCVVLVAKGKISNYYFGIIQTATYAYISYTYGLYGESMLNGLFYLPIQFIGIYLWNKNKTEASTIGEDVAVKRLSRQGWVILIIMSIVASAVYAYFLNLIGGQQVRLDSVAVVLSIVAQVLMLKRFAEQWVLWIVVNILSISLWLITLLKTGGNDWSMLVMWSAFLVNSVYGYINWIKMSNKQRGAAR